MYFGFKVLPQDFKCCTSDIEYLVHGYIDESPPNKQNWISLWVCDFPSCNSPRTYICLAQKGVCSYFSVGEFQMISYSLSVLKVWQLWAKPDN